MMGGATGVKGQENLTSPFLGWEGGFATVSFEATPAVLLQLHLQKKVHRETNRKFSV